MKIRAAISPCPNDVFIFAGLILERIRVAGLEFEFAYHELETLNREANESRWDLAKISYANHVSCAADYSLLRCGGALGRGCGPLLLSNRPSPGPAGVKTGTWDPAAEVLAPGRHTTANFLLDFFARDGGRHGDGDGGARPPRPLRKTFLPFDELYRRLLGPDPCQGVVIHEMRFTYAADGLYLIGDLGAFWEARTGFPIPLGAVALNRRLEAAQPGLAGIVEAAIRESLDWSYAHPAEALALCRAHSQSMAEDVLRSHIDLYVNAFSRDIGPEGEAAVAFFLSRQTETETGSQSGTGPDSRSQI
ncbi:MAG: 1,4-dihydroxy-6-naphthoate synthase [Fibrobacteres bacterium]|nr:1,4-dihydroxy-6-naphthoate synthase [Fibrobacterota bacterium]